MFLLVPASIRPWSVAVAALLSVALATPAAAQADPKPERKPAPARKPAEPKPAEPKPERAAASGPPGGAKRVEVFGDWGAYTAQSGRSKICYALSEPKSRSPGSLKDTKAYLFVSIRPGDNVRNEVASVLSFKTKEDGEASMVMGPTTYALITRGENAWIKSASDEPLAIATMAKSGSLVVQATSARGNKTTDRYSLSGFAQALERAKRDCP